MLPSGGIESIQIRGRVEWPAEIWDEPPVDPTGRPAAATWAKDASLRCQPPFVAARSSIMYRIRGSAYVCQAGVFGGNDFSLLGAHEQMKEKIYGCRAAGS